MLDKYGKGTPNDWIERHLLSPLNWVGILVMLAVDIYLFGFFVGPLVWGIQMIWIPFWAAGIINGVGHAVGYRNFDVKDESRNISPIAIWLWRSGTACNLPADPLPACRVLEVSEHDTGTSSQVYLRCRQSITGPAGISSASSQPAAHLKTSKLPPKQADKSSIRTASDSKINPDIPHAIVQGSCTQ